ncbi:MAG TPA: hypothetical protein VHI98_25640 [Vicinamibacterales bacterium]|nr:hypothetical protein [Vicinamibacterales bacterium]
MLIVRDGVLKRVAAHLYYRFDRDVVIIRTLSGRVANAVRSLAITLRHPAAHRDRTRCWLVDGVEWNVRLSQVGSPDILEKFDATFDTYWESPEIRVL